MRPAFVTQDGSCEFIKMLFGMVNTAATVARAKRKFLFGLEHADSCIDDILIHARTLEKRIQGLRVERIVQQHVEVL